MLTFSPVWVKVGICTADSIINLALCCLGYVPGLLHAWYIILKNPEPDYDDPGYQSIPGGSRRDFEGGQATYYYVSHQPLQHPSLRAYGTLGSQPVPEANTAPAAAKQSNNAAGQGQGGQGSSSQGQAPPTYAEAVKGDNKVQT